MLTNHNLTHSSMRSVFLPFAQLGLKPLLKPKWKVSPVDTIVNQQKPFATLLQCNEQPHWKLESCRIPSIMYIFPKTEKVITKTQHNTYPPETETVRSLIYFYANQKVLWQLMLQLFIPKHTNLSPALLVSFH